MQVCTSLQTDNHASTTRVSFLQAGCPSCRPTNSVKALKASSKTQQEELRTQTSVSSCSILLKIHDRSTKHVRSAGCHQLFVPRHRRSMFRRRACSVAGPAAWNSLPDYLRDPSRSFDSFRRDMKTFLFSFY